MAWQRFERQHVAFIGDPTVTIQKGGVFSLNAPAYRALAEPEHAELFYELEKQLVGIAKADSATPTTYKVRKLKGSPSWLISGRLFSKYHKIDTSVGRRWIAQVAPDGMLVIDLKTPAAAVGGGTQGQTLDERSPSHG